MRTFIKKGTHKSHLRTYKINLNYFKIFILAKQLSFVAALTHDDFEICV